MNFQFLEAKTRLIRIMGTFDLATGHADTFDELLDSLESELRDVLGHYREALKQHLTKEPVAMLERDPSIGRLRVTYEDAITELEKGVYPLYIKPPQREWQGLTDVEAENIIDDCWDDPDMFIEAIEYVLRRKNS